jgi:hypothetical protein
MMSSDRKRGRIADMKLQEKLIALKKDFEAKAPKDVVEIMHRATEDLKDSGIVERAVKVGDKAPDFSLQDESGRETSLKGLLSKRPIVLSFYRGIW